MDGSFWNFVGMSGMEQTTSDSVLGVIRQESWIQDHFELFVTIALKGTQGKPLFSLCCWHLANKMPLNQGFLGHIKLGQCRKCNYSSKRTQALVEVCELLSSLVNECGWMFTGSRWQRVQSRLNTNWNSCLWRRTKDRALFLVRNLWYFIFIILRFNGFRFKSGNTISSEWQCITCHKN